MEFAFWWVWLLAELPPVHARFLTAFIDELEKRGITNVQVTQTGCIGICQFEPVVEVVTPGKDKVTYVKMTPEMAVRVVNDHIVNGNVVQEFTIGAHTK